MRRERKEKPGNLEVWDSYIHLDDLQLGCWILLVDPNNLHQVMENACLILKGDEKGRLMHWAY